MQRLPSAPPRPLLSQAKFVCAVQGELNCCNTVGALEMRQRLEQLKERIHRVHLYSQGEAPPLPGPRNPASSTQDALSPVLCLALVLLNFEDLLKSSFLKTTELANQHSSPVTQSWLFSPSCHVFRF